MLGRKERSQLELFISGSLRQLIPDDHVLVRVERALDLSWLRDEVADCYCLEDGRPGPQLRKAASNQATTRTKSAFDTSDIKTILGKMVKGGETRRAAVPAADQIRTHAQPHSRQGARPRIVAGAAGARRRGDRVSYAPAFAADPGG